MTKLTLLTALLLATQATAFAPPASSARSPTAVSMQKEAVTRRSWLANTGAIFSSAVFLPRPALADSKLTPYQDGVLGYQISAPASWDKSEQQLADRRFLTLFMDPTSGADKTLMFIAKTPIQPDFTSLGSFGSVDQVAQMTILPKGELQGETTKSVMLSAVSKKNAYIFDYTACPPNQPETHYRVIFSLADGVLVTVTVQTPEARYGEMKPLFDEIIESYGKYKA